MEIEDFMGIGRKAEPEPVTPPERPKCPRCHSFVPLPDSLAHVVPSERWAERVREERAENARLRERIDTARSILMARDSDPEDALNVLDGWDPDPPEEDPLA